MCARAGSALTPYARARSMRRLRGATRASARRARAGADTADLTPECLCRAVCSSGRKRRETPALLAWGTAQAAGTAAVAAADR
eukprot:366297-Chlamydomonas_euryale.AAC.1